MNWLYDNYKFLFDGIGGLVTVAVIGWLFKRSKAETLPVKHSQQALGDGNTQSNIESARDVVQHFHAPMPAVQGASQVLVQTAKPERVPYNIKFIGADVCSLEETIGGGRFVERGSQKNAIVAKFANVPTVDGENKTVTVNAVLIYKVGEGAEERELLDIPGSWINGDYFEANDIRHKLIVGIVTNKGFTAMEEEDIRKYNRTFSRLQPHLLNGFASGTVFIRLTSSFASKVLYEGYFTINTDPVSIVPKPTAS